MKLQKLQDDLTEMFIGYQCRLDSPMHCTLKSEAIIKYQNDQIFHAKVDQLVAGVMMVVIDHLD